MGSPSSPLFALHRMEESFLGYHNMDLRLPSHNPAFHHPLFMGLSASVAEWLRSPPRDQQVDLEGLGSNHGASRPARLKLPIVGKMSTSFGLGYNPGLRFTSIISKEVTRLIGQRRAN